MIEHAKIEAVVCYLTSHFSGYTIEHKYDSQLGAEAFRLRHKPKTHYLKITEDYLNNTSPSSITDDLQRWSTESYIKSKGSKIIFINQTGPHLLEYEKTIGEKEL